MQGHEITMDYEMCTIDLKVPGWDSNKWNETWNEIQNTKL